MSATVLKPSQIILMADKIQQSFSLNSSIGSGTRLGIIHSWGTVTENVSIPTPNLLLSTKGGHIPNLTWDIASKYLKSVPERNILLIPVASVIDIQTNSKIKDYVSTNGLREFFRYPKSSLTYLSLHDPMVQSPSNLNGNRFSAISNYSGYKKITLEILWDIVDLCKLDVHQSLFDHDTQNDCNAKKCAKSVDRNLTGFLSMKSSNSTESMPVATINGGFNAIERERCLQLYNNEQFQMYSIEGFHNYGHITENIQQNWQLILEIMDKVMKNFPESKLRLFVGAINPKQMHELFKLGIDLFDTSYASLCAEKGIMFGIASDYVESGNFETIDLNNLKFQDDFSKPFEKCECYTCRKYTRAYLNHLCLTKEMLALILMSIHNIEEMFKMMSLLRNE